MRPALYYPWVYLKGGAERVLLELMQRSRHEWVLYTNHFDAANTFLDFAGMPVVALDPISVRRTLRDVAQAGVTLMRQRLDVRQHDSLFVVSEGLGNLVALHSTVPTSCICLTPLKIAYDRVTRARFFRGRWRLHYRAGIQFYASWERRAWRRYQRVFCNSGETRRRLLEAHLVEPGRVEVAYHGVDAHYFQPTHEREPFFLVPGRIMWSKNVELAIAAWRRWKPAPHRNHFRLVIAGMVDAKSVPYLRHLRTLARDRDDIVFEEAPTDHELLRLYQRCHAVVFPPPNEDWGLVPLEAMACGKPVLATDRGGPRESVVDGVTGFLRLDRPEPFAQAIHGLANMPRAMLDRLGDHARARAVGYGWQPFVNRIDLHVEEVSEHTPALTAEKPGLLLGT